MKIFLKLIAHALSVTGDMALTDAKGGYGPNRRKPRICPLEQGGNARIEQIKSIPSPPDRFRDGQKNLDF